MFNCNNTHHLKQVLLAILLFAGILGNAGIASAQYIKSGTVWEDYNGDRSVTAGEPVSNANNQLWAYLVGTNSGTVLQSQAVSASGTYSFTVASLGGGYTVGLGKAGISVGTVLTGGSTTYNSYFVFPDGWDMVFPNNATNHWLTVGNTTNVSSSFFIRKCPSATAITSSYICAATAGGCVSIPALSGTAATGNALYNIDNYRIVTIPATGTLKTGSTVITVGMNLTPAQASNLCYTPPTNGAGAITFKYLAADLQNSKYYFSDTTSYTIELGGASFRRDVASSYLLVCSAESVQLSDNNTADTTGLHITYTYAWSGPSGFTSTAASPILGAGAAVDNGKYILTLTDQSGCAAKDTFTAKVMNCFTPCDGNNAYILKGSGSTNAETFYRYNWSSGALTTLASNLTSNDAMAYNIYNNLIYGWSEGNSPSQHIYVTDAAGRQLDLGVSPSASSMGSTYYGGTIDNRGHWYVGQPNASTIEVVDVNPLSSTYLELINTIHISGGSFDPYDMVWNPKDSLLYGVSSSQLYILNPRSGVLTKYNATIPSGQGSYGAVFLDHNLVFHLSDSNNGNIYNLSLASTPAGSVTFTLFSSGPTGSYNDGAANPIFPSDYGDAPASYGTASHQFNCTGSGVGSELLRLGNTIDYEPYYTSSSDARFDDNSNSGSSDDDDGVSSFSPVYPCSYTSSYSVQVSTYNNTGSTATLSGWIDFNGNGTFDSNERAQATVANGQNTATLSWSGLHNTLTSGQYIYARFRIASTASEVANPTGSASIGEVEDYRIQVMGSDFGDAPSSLYGSPVSMVYPDNNNDNIPDDPAAVWLGTTCSSNDGSSPCAAICSNTCQGDDNDGVNDEDGCQISSFNGTSLSFVANGNTHNQVGYWGVWIDWDNNGFDNNSYEFYHGTFTVGSPVTVTVPTLVPPTGVAAGKAIRIRVSGNGPLQYSDYQTVLFNSETEDYVSGTPLPVQLLMFDGRQSGEEVDLHWATAAELNNDHFEIERSEDGLQFNLLGVVPGRGTYAGRTDYHYADATPKAGKEYYRLKQVDLNGEAAYSNLVSFFFQHSGMAYVYRTQSGGYVLKMDPVSEQGSAQLRICNMSGTVVYSGTLELQAGESSFSLDALDRQPQGIYVVYLLDQQETINPVKVNVTH